MITKVNTNKHNALSLMSFGASTALFMVSLPNCFDGAGWAVAMVGSMVYCMFWLMAQEVDG